MAAKRMPGSRRMGKSEPPGGRAEWRIWRVALEALEGMNPPASITAHQLAEVLGIHRNAAANLLRRLRSWGYVRLVGFAPSQGDELGRGRQRQVFELTDSGRNQANYKPRRGSQG